MKRKNPYASIAKKAWNNSCNVATEINNVCQLFKRMTNDLRLRGGTINEKSYQRNFMSIVNETWGSYLDMSASDFSECKEVLYEAKRLKFIIKNACEELKEQYKLANVRYS